MLARRSGMDYSQGIQFQTSLINMEEAKELTMNNQVLASRNNQRQEEQVILSTIRRQATKSLPQAGNDQTTNIRQYACKAKWDGL